MEKYKMVLTGPTGSKAPAMTDADELHLFAVEYAFIDGRRHEAEQAMLKFMLGFLRRYGRISLGLTEEEELDDNNFPVTTTLYGKHAPPRIKLTDVYLTDDGKYIHADGIDAETGEKRTGFYIYSEQYADIFRFVGHAPEMNRQKIRNNHKTKHQWIISKIYRPPSATSS